MEVVVDPTASGRSRPSSAIDTAVPHVRQLFHEKTVRQSRRLLNLRALWVLCRYQGQASSERCPPFKTGTHLDRTAMSFHDLSANEEAKT